MLAALALVPACGSSRAATDGPARSDLYECSVEAFPEVLPSPEALVDAAPLGRALRALPEVADGDVAGAFVLLSLGFQADGLNIRRDVIEHAVSAVTADSVQRLVFANVRQAPQMEREWGGRLRIEFANGIDLLVERREFCPPRPRDTDLELAIARYMVTGPRARGRRGQRTALARVRIDPAGHVESAWIVRGVAGGALLEADLTQFLRRFFFYPARLDGRPVPGLIDIPVRVRQ